MTSIFLQQLSGNFRKTVIEPLAGQFGPVSTLVEGYDDKMIVSLNDKDTKAKISFSYQLADDEYPRYLIRGSALSSYFGELNDFSQMANTILHGFQKAYVTGYRPLAVPAPMLGRQN